MNFKKTPAAAFAEKDYTHIPLTTVESNQVAAIGYNAANSTMAVTFTRGPGHIYHYPDVSPELHQQFMAAASIGKFFGEHIKALPFDKFPASVLVPVGTSADGDADADAPTQIDGGTSRT
ncbi:KTSC domain-containing protein [Acidovorax sp. Be4]|uniref:KTSC domain-containing protein n=1 Tax=Acidovorax bellezanensis TaxID=2976702 RepID=A0ABT2PTK4_9BURK|nr:KTSC domain-containing protein [Acidovorax sp. Be4]MCT9812453.1 KTSC domain-containing protein [Acidovorax sp. Be4]